MEKWQTVYDTDQMVNQYNERLQIIGLHVQERDDAVLTMIPYAPSDPFRLLELGTGMGRLTVKLLHRFPHVHITCVDGSERMLAIAQQRLAPFHGRTRFLHTDFSERGWVEAVPETFDVVVSIAAIHHIPDSRKRRLFKDVYDLLNPGGYFLNGDLIKSKHAVLNTKCYDDVWATHIQRKTAEIRGIERTIDDVRARMHAALAKEGDTPSTIDDQIRWLHAAGFDVADCIWQYFLSAILVGIKAR